MAQVNGKPVSGGQIILLVIGGLFLLGLVSNALGINTTSSAYCESTKTAVYNGTASNAAVERYFKDC